MAARTVVTAGAAALLAVCGQENAGCSTSQLHLGFPPASIARGEAITMKYTIVYSSACNSTHLAPTWSTSDPASLKVKAGTNQDATLEALAPTSKVVFRVAVHGLLDTAFIAISSGPPTTIQISPLAPSVLIGATRQMTAELRDAGGVPVDGALAWSSSVPSVATVNSTGLVTGVAVGTSTITATYKGVTPNLVALTVVTVTAAPAASLTVTPATTTLPLGATNTMLAVVKDAAGNTLSGRGVTWQSSAPSIASVGAATGIVTAVSLGGPVTIRATADENQAIFGDALVSVVRCTNSLVFADSMSTDLGTGWTTTRTLSNPLGSNHTDTVSYQNTGGNPTGYRRMVHAMVSDGTLNVYHRRELEYDPAVSGPISTIYYSEDQRVLNAPNSVGWGFFLEQGGIRYVKQVGTGVFSNALWGTASMEKLTAADFPGPPSVNFSATGGKIKFGYYRANTSTSGSYTVAHGIDNWRVEICRP